MEKISSNMCHISIIDLLGNNRDMTFFFFSKLGRAIFFMLQNNEAFNMNRFFSS